MWAVGKKGGSCFVRFGLHDGVAAELAHEAAVDDRMALGEARRTIIQSRPGDAARAHPFFVEQVDCRKWNIERIGAQNLGRIPASDLGTPLFCRTGAEIA
jgi:hypothetical protein